MTKHSVTAAAITDALIFTAVAMLLTRTIGTAMRARHAAHLGADNAASELQTA